MQHHLFETRFPQHRPTGLTVNDRFIKNRGVANDTYRYFCSLWQLVTSLCKRPTKITQQYTGDSTATHLVALCPLIAHFVTNKDRAPPSPTLRRQYAFRGVAEHSFGT